MKFTFIHRNRIIAALSEETILGETTPKGGAWHTVKAAWELNRNVFKLENNGDLISLPDPQKRLF